MKRWIIKRLTIKPWTIKPLGGLIPLLALAACSHTPPPQGQVLTQAPSFTLEGKLAIKTADDSIRFELNWRHENEHDAIEILHPMGGTLARLEQRPGLSRLILPDGKIKEAASAEALMQSLLGWTIPMQGLSYWISGWPAPGAAAVTELTRDPSGRIQQFQQSGWRIQYREPVVADGYWWPGRGHAERERISLDWVAYQWHLLETPAPTTAQTTSTDMTSAEKSTAK